MRSEQEMLRLVLAVAEQDERVRAVALTGSRADPAAKKDCLQDYDVAFFVTEMASFTRDHSWVDVFGPRVIMQIPEAMELFPPELGNWFTYLMQFCDGARIDLMLVPAEEADLYFKSEPLATPLLDKDGLLYPSTLTENPYATQCPTQRAFEECCNEFFWVSCYVAKGLWRGELLYAAHHLFNILHPMLVLMQRWRAGVDEAEKAGGAENYVALDTGKHGKHLHGYLPKEDWAALSATLRADSAEACWASLWGCVALFRAAGARVAGRLGFAWPAEEGERVCAWLKELEEATGGQTPRFDSLCP